MSVIDELNQWEKETGKCWVSEIQDMAERGGTWAEAARYFGVSKGRLQHACWVRGFQFPWKKAVRQRTMTPVLTLLQKWEKETGKCWYTKIEEVADNGGRWQDAAEVFGTEKWRLRSFCNGRGFHFNWHYTTIRAKTDPRMGTKPNVYRYKGKDWTLKELSAFTGLKVTTIYCRIHRNGWDVTRAIETPALTRSQAGELGGAVTKEKYEQKSETNGAQADRAVDVPHGLRTTRDMGRTQCAS